MTYSDSNPVMLGPSFNYGMTAGTEPAYTLTINSNPAFGSLKIGQCFTIKVHATATGAPTLNVAGTGALAVKGTNGVALVAGDWVSGQCYVVVYNGTDFTCVSPKATSGGGDTTAVTNTGGGAAVLKPSTNVTARTLVAGANVTVTQNTDDITIAATGGGGSETPLTGGVFLPWGYASYVNGNARVGTTGGIWRYPFVVQYPQKFQHFHCNLAVAGAAGTSVIVAIMAFDGTVLAKTDALLCDSTTGGGHRRFTWQAGSGAAMSGADLLLNPGNYYLIFGTSDTNIRIFGTIYKYHTDIINGSDWGTVGGVATVNFVGYRDSSTTGSGTSLDLNASSFASGWNPYSGDIGFPVVAFMP